MYDVVSIVGGGPSALECGAARAPGYVIAVNDAYQHVRHDAVLSMDGRWALHRMPDFGGRNGPTLWLRRRALTKLGGFNQVLWPRVRVFDCDHNSPHFGGPGQLNGGNSGYCAMNLAWQMWPKTVYLFGFDHTGGHFHPEYEWRLRGEGSCNSPEKFRNWAKDCKRARELFDERGVEVFNTSDRSTISAFTFKCAP